MEPRKKPRKRHDSQDTLVLPALLRKQEEFPSLLPQSLIWELAESCSGHLRGDAEGGAVAPDQHSLGSSDDRVPDPFPSAVGPESVAGSKLTCRMCQLGGPEP